GLIFPGPYAGNRIATARLRDVISNLGQPYTTHGFRSTFSQWAADCTNYPYEVREMALAHNVGGHVERAYQHSDLVELRRRLMEDLANYIAVPLRAGDLVPIRQSASAD